MYHEEVVLFVSRTTGENYFASVLHLLDSAGFSIRQDEIRLRVEPLTKEGVFRFQLAHPERIRWKP